jgi:hypothetical protein
MYSKPEFLITQNKMNTMTTDKVLEALKATNIALCKLRGIEAWIGDREMTVLFQSTVYPTIENNENVIAEAEQNQAPTGSGCYSDGVISTTLD